MGSKVGITASEKLAMAAMYDGGASIRQVAARFGVTYTAVHYHLTRAGMRFRSATGAAR